MKKVVHNKKSPFELKTTGERVKNERTNRNMTQEELAKKLFCSRDYIIKLENNSRMPSLEMIKAISIMFNVSADYLLCLSNNRNSENSDIANKLGLTNEAIETLIYFNKVADSLPLTKTIDLLLTDERAKFFFTFCVVYLYGENQKIKTELPIGGDKAFCRICFNSEEIIMKEIENILKELKGKRGDNNGITKKR